MEYIRIPAVSPAFDQDWETSRFLWDALTLAKDWVLTMDLDNTTCRIITEKDRTPVLLIEIEASKPDLTDLVLLYGHLDKQPPATGWDSDKGPWQPVIVNDRLYGRGAADDGYALFTAVTAIKALQTHQIPHGRCVILIETCEESGSKDLEHYLGTLQESVGRPDLIVCLDSGCGDYERMWITTSLRGSIVGRLEARILTQDIHSGLSGMVASSFRIIRRVLDRIEDATTGELLIPELYGPIPENRMNEICRTADFFRHDGFPPLPLVKGAMPVSRDPIELLVNSTWKPSLSYIGAQGFPPLEKASNAIRESTQLLLSFRTPPRVDTEPAAEKIKTILETDPPYGSRVAFHILKQGRGWDMPDMGHELETRIHKASSHCFGRTPGHMGEGGSIPFMTLLEQTFPMARFLVTGTLGPNSNAHGPNESLHLTCVKRLTQALSLILGDI